MKPNPFYQLSPEIVLSSADRAGFYPTGEFTQLNSYENRVFDLRLEDKAHIIAKFYRPQRWSEKAIYEEHQFLFDLQEEEISVVTPLVQNGKKTLSLHEQMWVAFFPKILGRMPDEFIGNDLQLVGRLLARVHNVGEQQKSKERPIFKPEYFGTWQSIDLLNNWIAPEVKSRYLSAATTILGTLDEVSDTDEFIRIHGDCHRGNLLHSGKEFFLVDFDDFGMGPAIQDFWMLLSGDKETESLEKEQLLSGYEELRHFPHHQWNWIPLYRGFRIINYACWIAKRWGDPSFPKLFPDFNTYGYWAEETEALERIAWSINNV